MKPRSIRFSATILYTSILFGILTVYSGVLFGFTRHILYRNLDAELRLKAAEIAGILKSYEKLQRLETPHRHLLNKLLGLPDHARLIMEDLWRSDMQALNLEDDYIAVVDASGRPVIHSRNFDASFGKAFEEQVSLSLGGETFQNLNVGDRHLRAANFPFVYGDRQLLVIRIATPMDDLMGTLRQMLYFIVAGIGVILSVTSFMGGFFARRILRPVVTATDIVEEISHSDLHLRIPEMEADAEMRRLITAFNAMIDRLETAFAHANEFSSHVAHELKTPLAVIRGEVELALQEHRDPEEYQRVLAVVAEEIERLIRTINDLMLLARLDYNPGAFSFENIDLKAFLTEIHEFTAILGTEKGVASRLSLPEGGCSIRADRVHLRRLLLNLIHNAVKFSPEGGEVRVDLRLGDGEARISVADTGPGIDPADLGKVFEKFFRGGGAGDSPGSGLGLSIAQSIAKAHQGRISVDSTPGKGSVFTVSLPAEIQLPGTGSPAKIKKN